MKSAFFKNWLIALSYLGMSSLGFSQFSTQGFATNYGGGKATGTSITTEVNTSYLGGFPESEESGIYLGLTSFNLKSGVITVNTSQNGNTIADEVVGTLLRVEETGNYDSIDVVSSDNGAFSFNPVFLGSYLLNVDSDPERYVATYYGDAFLWDEADILELSKDTLTDISIINAPTEDPTAEGLVAGTIEEDFDEEENARVEARRRAKKRKCGLRRRNTGGRVGQVGEFELIAYGETNENGEFEYGFLPQGTYRFFVEYPGIPIEESSFVEFEIGASGVSDDSFVLTVFATEEGISIELLLGVTSDFFKEIKVYPNPSSDYINISYSELLFDQLNLQLTDMNGKSVLQEQMLSNELKHHVVDISGLQSGLYLLRFTQPGKSDASDLVFRFLKQ